MYIKRVRVHDKVDVLNTLDQTVYTKAARTLSEDELSTLDVMRDEMIRGRRDTKWLHS